MMPAGRRDVPFMLSKQQYLSDRTVNWYPQSCSFSPRHRPSIMPGGGRLKGSSCACTNDSSLSRRSLFIPVRSGRRTLAGLPSPRLKAITIKSLMELRLTVCNFPNAPTA